MSTKNFLEHRKRLILNFQQHFRNDDKRPDTAPITCLLSRGTLSSWYWKRTIQLNQSILIKSQTRSTWVAQLSTKIKHLPSANRKIIQRNQKDKNLKFWIHRWPWPQYNKLSRIHLQGPNVSIYKPTKCRKSNTENWRNRKLPSKFLIKRNLNWKVTSCSQDPVLFWQVRKR